MRERLSEKELAALRGLWEAFGRSQERSRAERDAYWAGKTDADVLAMSIERSRGDTDEYTRQLLGLAVPMWIDKMRHWRGEYREQQAHRIGEEIAASHALMADENPGGRVPRAERGTVAAGFNLLAEGLAILAYCPGGVVFGGHHWVAT